MLTNILKRNFIFPNKNKCSEKSSAVLLFCLFAFCKSHTSVSNLLLKNFNAYSPENDSKEVKCCLCVNMKSSFNGWLIISGLQLAKTWVSSSVLLSTALLILRGIGRVKILCRCTSYEDSVIAWHIVFWKSLPSFSAIEDPFEGC